MFKDLYVEGSKIKEIFFDKKTLLDCSVNFIKNQDDDYIEFEIHLIKTLKEDIGIGHYEYQGSIGIDKQVIIKVLEIGVNVLTVNNLNPKKDLKNNMEKEILKYLNNFKWCSSIEV